MGYAQKILPHYTYDDYIHWEGRWELLEGHPIAMSPMPMPKHQRVAVTLTTEFELAIRQAKCKKCKVYQPLDYKISEDTLLQPDMLIVCKKMTKSFLDFPPLFVAEILSPSTALRDLNTKFEIYQNQGVRYYLIVDSEKESFDLYEILDQRYLLVSYDYTRPYLFAFDDCKIEVVLNEIWENI